MEQFAGVKPVMSWSAMPRALVVPVFGTLLFHQEL